MAGEQVLGALLHGQYRGLRCDQSMQGPRRHGPHGFMSACSTLSANPGGQADGDPCRSLELGGHGAMGSSYRSSNRLVIYQARSSTGRARPRPYIIAINIITMQASLPSWIGLYLATPVPARRRRRRAARGQ